MRLRPYAEEDLFEILDVWYRASQIAHSFLSEDFLSAERQEIAERWIPMADTTVCEVGGIFVDPEHQRKGIGSALLDQACRSQPHLELDVLEKNSIGRGFYEAYGFELVDRHIDDDTGQPALRLRFG
jgi:putative acetyltransferase